MGQGDGYLEDLDFKSAIECYTKVIKNNDLPFGVPIQEVYNRRALCYHKLNKFTEAKVLLFLLSTQLICINSKILSG